MDDLIRATRDAAPLLQVHTTEQVAIIRTPCPACVPTPGVVAFQSRTMRHRRTRQLALLLLAPLGLGLAACSASPRQEYLQTRAVEITPSSTGDGTTLASRDKIMTGDKGPSTPLASVESPPDKQ